MLKYSTPLPSERIQTKRESPPAHNFWLLRAIFLLIGVGLLVCGALATEAWMAANLAPNGRIVEVAYVYALRALAVGIGGLLTMLALLASARTLQNYLLMIVVLGVALGGLEVSLRIVDWFSTASHPDS